jgi:hypothetical protein
MAQICVKRLHDDRQNAAQHDRADAAVTDHNETTGGRGADLLTSQARANNLGDAGG